MVMVLTLDVLSKLKGNFRSLSLRIGTVTENMKNNFLKIFDNFHDPEKIEILLIQKDVDG